MISSNYTSVRQAHYDGRIIFAAIWIDQQSRKVTLNHWRVQPLGKPSRYGLCTNIVANMLLKDLFWQSKSIILPWYRITCMIAKENDAATGVAGNDFKG